jgi:hypothetical protein
MTTMERGIGRTSVAAQAPGRIVEARARELELVWSFPATAAPIDGGATDVDGRLVARVSVTARGSATLHAWMESGMVRRVLSLPAVMVLEQTADGDLSHLDISGGPSLVVRLTFRNGELVYARCNLPERAGLCGGCYGPPKLSPEFRTPSG